jgi:hypothetical protein
VQPPPPFPVVAAACILAARARYSTRAAPGRPPRPLPPSLPYARPSPPGAESAPRRDPARPGRRRAQGRCQRQVLRTPGAPRRAALPAPPCLGGPCPASASPRPEERTWARAPARPASVPPDQTPPSAASTPRSSLLPWMPSSLPSSWAECMASRPHRPSAPDPAPSPRCCGMTRLTCSWHSSTFRLGVSRTFASWFLSSWSQSRPKHAGGTYSSPFAATLWMTTFSATPLVWRRPPRGCASTASCSPGSWGRSSLTSTASSGTFLTLGLFGLPSRASFWVTPRPGLSVLTQPSAPSSRGTSASVSTAAR